MRKYRILLVDDDIFILTGIAKDLESEGYNITTADNGSRAIELLKVHDFDLVITDLVMDTVDGIQVLAFAKEHNPDTMVIILTGYGDLDSAIDAIRAGTDDYMLKPCEPEEMYFRVSRCIEKIELKNRLKSYENILPVCCVCKSIRDDSGSQPGKGRWVSVEKYIHSKGKMDITSTYCPECARKAMEEIDGM
jgi:YesN/AraC family two-component response regulator